MENRCTTTIQAVKKADQNLGNQQVRLQNERLLTRRCFSVSGGIVVELSLRRKVILFHQHNARPPVSTMSSRTLYTLEWDLMQHPPHSPAMTLSNYYQFLHLQLQLEGTVFTSNEKVINEVNHFLDSCTPQRLAEGIEKLPKR
ncbi:histone-lysine N-methyltransferase SETMAR [Trichonephila clavipes]|nr:histone-lysine N-methyltransferase SETMAR [Trichonephila clavipes]